MDAFKSQTKSESQQRGSQKPTLGEIGTEVQVQYFESDLHVVCHDAQLMDYLQPRQPQNDKALGHNGRHKDGVDRLMDGAHRRDVLRPVGANDGGGSGGDGCRRRRGGGGTLSSRCRFDVGLVRLTVRCSINVLVV